MTQDSGLPASTQIDPAAVAATIHDVWAEVLEAETIEPQTHFFDAGGHSVAAMRVMIRLRREWDVALPTRLIFDQPVLADFTSATSAILTAG
ncbi:MAG: phosphopantetheine-binding protein [Actinomycetota bacterium]|nr:phosphopantetheine-binding protein [Actinomycetota bacterium]MDQ2955640.1 phosphopantetheine-binding protein [Actinomycetota bacterium]